LLSIGQDPKKDSEEDFTVIHAMMAAGQTVLRMKAHAFFRVFFSPIV